MRGRLIGDEHSFQIKILDIRLKGLKVSSGHSPKASCTAGFGYIAGLSISKQSLMVEYILPPNLPMASKDLKSTSPFLTMSG
jgi:hypothetical protein